MTPSPMRMSFVAATLAIAVAQTPREETEHLRMPNHARSRVTLGGFESSATGGKPFAMEQTRMYEGPTIDFDTSASSPFRGPPDEEMCERWVVLTSIFEPTVTVNQLAQLSGWCVVVVGDKNGEASNVRVGMVLSRSQPLLDNCGPHTCRVWWRVCVLSPGFPVTLLLPPDYVDFALK